MDTLEDVITKVRSSHAEIPGMTVKRLIRDVKEFWNIQLEDFAHKNKFGPYPDFRAVVNFLRSIDGATLTPTFYGDNNYFVNFKRPENQSRLVSMIHASVNKKKRGKKNNYYPANSRKDNQFFDKSKPIFNPKPNFLKPQNRQPNTTNNYQSRNFYGQGSSNKRSQPFVYEHPWRKNLPELKVSSSSIPSCPSYLNKTSIEEFFDKLIDSGTVIGEAGSNNSKTPSSVCVPHNNKIQKPVQKETSAKNVGFSGLTKVKNINFCPSLKKKNLRDKWVTKVCKKSRKLDVLPPIMEESAEIDEELQDNNNLEQTLDADSKKELPTVKEVEKIVQEDVPSVSSSNDIEKVVDVEEVSLTWRERLKICEEQEEIAYNNVIEALERFKKKLNSCSTSGKEGITSDSEGTSPKVNNLIKFPIIVNFTFSTDPLRLLKATRIG